jgi:hypothetical protein
VTLYPAHDASHADAMVASVVCNVTTECQPRWVVGRRARTSAGSVAALSIPPSRNLSRSPPPRVPGRPFSHGARFRESRHGGEGDGQGGQSRPRRDPQCGPRPVRGRQLLVVVIGLQALVGAGVLEALTRRRACRPHDERIVSDSRRQNLRCARVASGCELPGQGRVLLTRGLSCGAEIVGHSLDRVAGCPGEDRWLPLGTRTDRRGASGSASGLLLVSLPHRFRCPRKGDSTLIVP